MGYNLDELYSLETTTIEGMNLILVELSFLDLSWLPLSL
jgi:hypothetical protein